MPPEGDSEVAVTEPARTADLAQLNRGLDVLTADDDSANRRPLWRRVTGSVVPPLLAAGLVLLVWQILVWAKVKPTGIPAPHAVWLQMADFWHRGVLQRAIWLSLSRGLSGFAIAVVIGTPLGLLVARVRFVRTAIGPLLAGLQSLPSVAWVPLAIVISGLTPATIYTVVLLGAVPSIANGMVAGIDQTPPLYLRVGRVLGARGLVAARHIVLPAAMPGYVAGLKQGWAFSWRSLMAAELITQSPKLGTGVGQLLDAGRETLTPEIIYGMIIVILVLGIAVDQIIFAPLERSVLRRRGLSGGLGATAP